MYPEFNDQMTLVKNFLHAFENALGLAISIGNEKSAAEYRIQNTEVLVKKAVTLQQQLNESERVMANQRTEMENRTNDARANLAGVEAQLAAAREEFIALKTEHDRVKSALDEYRAVIATL